MQAILSRVLAIGGVVAVVTASIGLVTFMGSGPAAAAVTMGTLDITGDDASVDSPPSAIDIEVSGDWAVESASTPEMVRVTMQVHVDGVADDLDTVSSYDATSGSYTLSADLFSHRAVAQGDLTPDATGASKATDVKVRVIVSAVDSGEIVAEEWVEDTATVTISNDGIDVEVGGTGAIDVVA